MLGVAALQAEGETRKRLLQLTAACDAADLTSSVLGRRAGYLSPGAALLTGGVALSAAVVATAAAAGE